MPQLARVGVIPMMWTTVRPLRTHAEAKQVASEVEIVAVVKLLINWSQLLRPTSPRLTTTSDIKDG